jgi:3-dehydroquinate dehydratase/shikimate dehydrogenase
MPGVFGKGRICAVAAAPRAAALAEQVRRGLLETRTIELRLDWLRDSGEIDRFIRWIDAQRRGILRPRRATLIATCRRRAAGGKFRGSVAEEMRILREAARAGCGWLDLEIESAEKLAAEDLKSLGAAARLLISYHDFRCTPDLRGVARRLARAGGDGGTAGGAIKIATLAKSYGDAVRVMQTARARRNVVAIPMGELAATRVLALRAGSALAYAPLAEATAPGQLSLDDLVSLYCAGRIDLRTAVYGVIGNPIHHSLSPHLHNAGFQARRINAVYVPFLVRDLRDFLEARRALGVAGFSVTIPHKETLLKLLDGCDPLAAEIGAVNTVVVRGGGKLFGYNTDYVGVLRALERRISLAGSAVLILGAGGSARAVAFALARAGANVRICARRPARARSLARVVGGEAIERRHLRREFFDAIVNTTPVGMYPHANESPLAAGELNCRLVFDAVYRPRRTKLLAMAERRGIESVSGLDMFVAQGTAQWEIWTGERAPVEKMRRAVVAVLDCEERGKSAAHK